MQDIMDVYIVMIDSKGILAFQPFTRERWDKLSGLFTKGATEKSHLLFKIKLNEIESNMVKAMINNKKYYVAANMLVNLRKIRGDAY